MQISLKWLNEYVDLSDKSIEEITHALTMSGLEVEEVEKIGPKFFNISVAKIEKINNHPNADKLHLVTLTTKWGEKTVVCGAQNIQEGQIIPYATIGSKVFSRKTLELFELTPIKIRDVESEGMLCSQDELGIEKMQEEDGILILNRFFTDLKIGQPLEKVLNIEEDTVLHLAPTANRGDEMSVLGVAQELSAIFNKKLNFSYLENTNCSQKTDFKVEILDKDVCKYYSIAILKDLKLKPSPAWLQHYLNTSGMRPINNIVDITNYVLLEYGTPLHAFDYDKLNNFLSVRKAKEGEKLVTLDNIERTLTSESVLIATKEQGVCLAGVFGGANSEVDENTKNIALEAAYFYPTSTRKSARSVGYRSEASARFERGIDIERIKPGLFRAIELLIKYADAKFEGIAETGDDKAENIEITLRFPQIKRILGIEIPSDQCCTILSNLGFELLGKNDLAAKFKVPSWRINDVTREIDLIEEIARIHGFDKIMPTLPKNNQVAKKNKEADILKKLQEIFIAKGFNEAVSSSLIGENLLNQFEFSYSKAEEISAKNYQSEDFKLLRQSLIPNMLQIVKYNFDNAQKDFAFYEIGKTYLKKQEPSLTESGVEETRFIAGAICGNITQGIWQGVNNVDFYSVKGLLENIFEVLKITNRIKYIKTENVHYLHPNISTSVILLGKTPKTLATFGLLHPAIKQKQKMLQDVYLFEINLELLQEAFSSSVIKYKKLPLYPEVQRDLAFIANENISNEDILKVIKKSVESKLFKNAEIFDVYQGNHIEKGFKSLAYRIKLQDENSTLTDEIVEKQIDNIRAQLKKAFTDITFRE